MRHLKSITPFDIAIIILLLSFSGLLFFRNIGSKGTGRWAVVECDQDRLRISLSQDGKYVVRGVLGNTVLKVEDGQIKVLNSPCKMKLCERRGWMSRPGESIVCLPNHIAVFVEDTLCQAAEVDTITE